MEHRLLSVTDSALREDNNLSPKFAAAVLSLITNPFTSDSTLSSLLEALVLRLQNPKSNSDHQRVLSLLSALSHHHPRLRHRIAAAAHAFILLPSTPTPSLPHALSLLDPAHHFQPDPFSDESLCLSLCFWQCVKTRRWILRNLNKFRVRPSVLLTVLLGFTKDPYPCIREAALDGLVMLSNGIVVEDPSLVEGCYFRAVELLFDAEKSVRLLAVRAVSEWGHLLLALNGDKTQTEWSDALFVQDEAEIFYVLYKIGRTHGKFVTSIIHEVSQELEPSFDGKLGFDKKRTAALLVLAISAPVSLERSICSIPPRIYSYAVTLLGRLSTGLVHVMDQNTLLAYLSHCSKFTVASTSENFEGELLNFDLKDGFSHLWKKSDASSFPESMELKKVTTPVHDYLLNSHIKATSCVEIVFRKVVDLWPLIQLQCMNKVVRTLRSWKEELRHFSCDPRHPAGVLGFALRYLHVIKLLGKAWTCYFSQRNLQFTETGVLEALLHKMESRLKEMLYRHAGLSRGEQLHILELMLVAYTLRLSCGGTSYFEDYINKLKNNISCEIGHSKDGFIYKLDRLEKSLNLFFLKHIVLSGELKYLDAEVDVCAYEFQDPLPFIPGLPVGMPFDITLYNISSETRLWLTFSLGEKSAQFVFLDLSEFGGSNEIRSLIFLSPFFGAPKAKRFSLKASIAMECLSEDQHFKHCNGPKHELIHLCKEKEVHLSTPVK
ncbi:UNVERIFIED_CONTAM: protein SIEL [Sesamum angustifolium]|uniref:Protein SIEL n=1 Tax=Sesamum angustifolium TaxID=2727405 RepID=A0AAW2N584_9LAMI